MANEVSEGNGNDGGAKVIVECPRCGIVKEINVYERVVKRKRFVPSVWLVEQTTILEVEKIECAKCGAECKVVGRLSPSMKEVKQ